MPLGDTREILDTVRALCGVEPVTLATHDRRLLGPFRIHGYVSVSSEAREPNSAARHIRNDVRRFDVPMDEPARMHMVQRPRNFDQCATSASNHFSPLKRYIGSRLSGYSLGN
jgi:hypothetical protein